jgi:hypothetical protein
MKNRGDKDMVRAFDLLIQSLIIHGHDNKNKSEATGGTSKKNMSEVSLSLCYYNYILVDCEHYILLV